jgi:hypothetical protein
MDTSSPSATGQKRKRSPLDTQMPHPVSSRAPGAEGQQFHLQINYLARRDATNLPIVSATDTLPNILGILDKYAGVLERHESVAANLGCRPLGPILIKRFERLFDGPVRVVHHTQGIVGATPVTWLDVVEFAKARPQDFTLSENKDGGRVCRCWINQCEVEISEEDYVLIASGMPQKIIPPQPIEEDEEKELGSLETLEKNLSQIILSADAGTLTEVLSAYTFLSHSRLVPFCLLRGMKRVRVVHGFVIVSRLISAYVSWFLRGNQVSNIQFRNSLDAGKAIEASFR